MQVVRHHEHAAAAPVANPGDQIVDLALPGDVDALDRLVEHQEIGLAQERAGEQHALQLAARDRLDRARRQPRRPDFGERGGDAVAAGRAAEREKAGHG